MKIQRKLESYLIKVISKEKKGLIPILILGLLSILEIIYLILLNVSRAFIRSKRLPVPVISVGNIVAGGTGKTPTVVWVVNVLKKAGFTPAVLTRGYRASAKSDGLIFDDSQLKSITPDITGDEPYLLAGLLPGTVIAVGRDRYLMGLKALEVDPKINVLVMDDGFQYLKLQRDLDVLALDLTQPFGNGHLIPRGTLREPLTGLKRAGLILMTRATKVEPEAVRDFTGYLQRISSGTPIGVVKEEHSELIPLSFWQKEASSGEPVATSLQGKKVAAITGIGNPRQYLASLESLGAEVGYFKAYPDHYVWEENEIENIVITLRDWGFKYLIVTVKDGVKLRAYAEIFKRSGVDCYMLSLEYQVEDCDITDSVIKMVRKAVSNQ